MADEALRSTAPVGAPGGYAGRPAGYLPSSPGKQSSAAELPVGDSVRLLAAASIAPELVRERVLAHTRDGLELAGGEALPQFAEVRQDEPAALFLGRVLSAQNQLAARRASTWSGERRRRCLDEALRSGCQEALDILIDNECSDRAAVQFVVEVLAEYRRRLDSVLAELRSQ